MRGIYSYRWARFFNGDVVHHEYVTETMTERSGDALRRFADGPAPFFTVINHVAPHVTLTKPHLPRWQHRYDDAYLGVRPPSFDAPSFNEQHAVNRQQQLRRHDVHVPGAADVVGIVGGGHGGG